MLDAILEDRPANPDVEYPYVVTPPVADDSDVSDAGGSDDENPWADIPEDIEVEELFDLRDIVDPEDVDRESEPDFHGDSDHSDLAV